MHQHTTVTGSVVVVLTVMRDRVEGQYNIGMASTRTTAHEDEAHRYNQGMIT